MPKNLAPWGGRAEFMSRWPGAAPGKSAQRPHLRASTEDHLAPRNITVPWQVYYNASRRLILKGVDGLVFVADSQASRAEANIEAMHNLYENLETYGYELDKIPFAIQYNKRDMPGVLTPAELRAQINPMGVPDFEGVATQGKGVFETLSCVSKLVVQSLS